MSDPENEWRRDQSTELLKATVSYELAAMKPPFVLNGGAVIAYISLHSILVRVETSASDESAISMPAVVFWLAGLLSATAVTALGYLSQWHFRKLRNCQVRMSFLDPVKNHDEHEKELTNSRIDERLGHTYRNILYGFYLTSILTFVFGVWYAAQAIL